MPSPRASIVLAAVWPLVCLLVWLLPLDAVGAAPSAARGRVEALLAPARLLQACRTPGFAVAVFTAQGLDWEAGYGVTTAAPAAAAAASVTAGTRFQAASVSKVAAAVCAMRMAAAGVLSLDAPVNERLDSWRLPNRFGRPVPPVRLRELLSHTAGVNVPGFPGYDRGAGLPTLLEILQGSPPAVTPPVAVTLYPGSVFRYSGGGTTVVQQLLQDVSGRPYAELVRELVLEPCGMASSGFAAPRGGDVALGHDALGAPLPGGWRVYPELAAAGLWSTAGDLARLGRSLCLAAAGRSAEPLPQAWARAMFALHARDGDLGMGLGLFVQLGRERAVFHEGANRGYRCLLFMLPERCEGLAVMTNAENGRSLAMQVLQAVAEVYGWQGIAGGVGRAEGPEPLPQAALEAFAGRWRDAHGGETLLAPLNGGKGGLGLQLFQDMVPIPCRLAAVDDGSGLPMLAAPDPLDPLLLRRDGEALVVERRLFGDLRLRRVESPGKQ